ncbi:uncharacterized protein LOC129641171 [Bubalus kerabau]|uniref:uncharacterized protein LOC129641171 n=1 Tax=Bubalus carabanensis TaxID=3119969 RepID=UPI00244EEC62|nr:uncharacterized protein LOC129641171 [Bubalus carabanensis]
MANPAWRELVSSLLLTRTSCEKPRDCGTWWAAVYEVAQSRTRLKRISSGCGGGSSSSSRSSASISKGLRTVRILLGGSLLVPCCLPGPPVCSCLEKPRDCGTWWAAVYEVAQSRTRLKRISSGCGGGSSSSSRSSASISKGLRTVRILLGGSLLVPCCLPGPPVCSCLEKPRDCGTWWAAVYEVAQSRTRLKRISSGCGGGSSSSSRSSASISKGLRTVRPKAQWLLIDFPQYFFIPCGLLQGQWSITASLELRLGMLWRCTLIWTNLMDLEQTRSFSYLGHEQEKLMAVVLEMCIDSLAARSVNTLPTSAGYGSDNI